MRPLTYDDWGKPVRIMCRCCKKLTKTEMQDFVASVAGTATATEHRLNISAPCGKWDYWYSKEYRLKTGQFGTVGVDYELNFINDRFYVEDLPPGCECGAHKVGSKIHSHWCPMNHERAKS